MGLLLLSPLASVFGESVPLDPGVRGGAAGAGGPISGLTGDQVNLFRFVTGEFTQLHSVSGNMQGEKGNGLGPGYNANGCGSCHSAPAVGGSSPRVNPQIQLARLDGAHNLVPAFLDEAGPIRVVRFIRNPDGTPDGGVYNLFTIEGRRDAPGCVLPQPDFAAQAKNHNLTFRIPGPLFGSGLIDNISDAAILANKAANIAGKAALGISGRENRNPNDGTITRFGWKAQNRSLLMFSGEAYNVEMGVTNELFPSERNSSPWCDYNNAPEDRLDFDSSFEKGGVSSGTQNFTTFMRLLAPPSPAAPTASTAGGGALFTSIGCALCHTPSLSTAASDLPGLSNQNAQLFSDLLVFNKAAPDPMISAPRHSGDSVSESSSFTMAAPKTWLRPFRPTAAWVRKPMQ
jgi:mono/diheme cytochrome c family protein